MQPPDTSKEQLIAEERGAERAVVEAESALLFAEANGSDTARAAAAERLAESRLGSLHMRERLQDGMAAWTRYAAFLEAVAHANANGIALPGEVSA